MVTAPFTDLPPKAVRYATAALALLRYVLYWRQTGGGLRGFSRWFKLHGPFRALLHYRRTANRYALQRVLYVARTTTTGWFRLLVARSPALLPVRGLVACATVTGA